MPTKYKKYKNYKFEVMKCHPDSGFLNKYTLSGFLCPFCRSNLDFEIMEKKGEDGKLFGREISYSCEDCGKVIGIGFCCSGITFEEIVNREMKAYKKWKCNSCMLDKDKVPTE